MRYEYKFVRMETDGLGFFLDENNDFALTIIRIMGQMGWRYAGFVPRSIDSTGSALHTFELAFERAVDEPPLLSDEE